MTRHIRTAFRKLRSKQDGFTLVELLTVTPILMIIVAVSLTFIFNQFAELSRQSAIVNLQLEAQTVVNTMQDDLFFSEAFLERLGTEDNDPVDPHEPSPGWRARSGPQPWELIVSTPSLTSTYRDPNRQVVYANEFGCSPQEVLESNTPLFNSIVYFMQQGPAGEANLLYKRYLTPPNSIAKCGTPFLTQTCPEAFATPTCPKDILLTSKLDSFSVTYYMYSDSMNTEIPVSTTANMVHATRAEVTVRLKSKSLGDPITASAKISVKRIN